MDLQAVRLASRQELAEYAAAVARNADELLADAELLAGGGRNGRAYSLSVQAVEATGKAMELCVLAVMPDSERARAPLRAMLKWHQLKLVGGLLLAVLPFGGVATKVAVMPADELAEHLAILFAPAEAADRLKRRGMYADLEMDGLHVPWQITADEVATQLAVAREAVASLANVVLCPGFQAWLEDPPPEGVELAAELVAVLSETDDVRTPMAATTVIVGAITRYLDRL